MATRNVVVEGDEVLRKHAKSAGPVTPHLREILEDMVDTMREENGVGLAAPQVGIMRRMFVAQPDPGDDATVYYMIDPVITYYSDEKEWGVEGCLSVPDMIGDVERPVAIRIEATDLNGERHEFEFEGFEARVMQHEYDHLDGILYTDKCRNLRPAYSEDEEDEFEEDGTEAEE
ncbi:MAG: peptide deformylase [Clostridia bacterium]|nr:peptide deformylase [Clostridia bacterium]